MKKSIVLISLIVVLLSSLVIGVCALVLQEENVAQEPASAFEAICAVAKSENGSFSVSVLDQRDIFTDLSDENLKQIFEAFDVILAENETLELVNVRFIRDVVLGMNYTNEDGRIIVSTDEDSNRLKYALFVAVYIENFPEFTAPVFSEEDHMLMNRITTDEILISFDYTEHGYDDISDYFNDMRHSEEMGEQTYVLAPFDIDMWQVKGNEYGDPNENMLYMLNSNETQRQEEMKNVQYISDLPPEVIEQFKDILSQ
jgi:hypothetical protein